MSKFAQALLVGCALLVAPPTSMDAQLPPERAAVPGMRIDGNAELFSPFDRVFVATTGTIFVPQISENAIWLFSPTGKRIGTVGRKGEGPGEFRMALLGEYGWTGDSLWVYDQGNRRLTLFSSAGGLIRTQPMSMKFPQNTVQVGGRRLSLEQFSIRTFSTKSMSGRADYSFTDSSTGEVFRESFLARLDTSGSVQKLLAKFPAFPVSRVRARVGQAAYSTLVPFAGGVRTEASRRGAYLVNVSARESGANTQLVDVLLVRPGGDTLYSRSFPVKAVPIPKKSADSAIAVALERISYSPDKSSPPSINQKPSAVPAVRSAIESELRKLMPRAYKPVRDVTIGDDGTVWLNIRTGEDRFGFLVIDVRGNPAMTVNLPHNALLAHASRDTLWAVEKDADDVPSLVRYTLQRPK